MILLRRYGLASLLILCLNGGSQGIAADQELLNMSEQKVIIAQLVMKDADGSSILTKDAGRAKDASLGDLDPERVDEIESRLTDFGFEVLSSNPNTLSITGTDALFSEMFGTSLTQLQNGDEMLDRSQISPELEPFVADLFVAPPPQTFP